MRATLSMPRYRRSHRVFRLTGRTATEACRHRSERVAHWCARRQTRRAEAGVFYDVRPAVIL